MTYQVLARKWRPKDFASLVGQEHVVRALTHALDGNRLHHAYLFTGTRGVGKTTLARIFAKALNCEAGVTSTPCGVCRACREIDEGRFVDYVEMDAASNRGVDEMAALLERAVYAPVDARFKVYMIDEVHMLTNHAFNAMLKTLEEPPAHVKFILATTDPQKIPVTVLSRCLQFNLKQMPAGHIVAHLEHVLGEEKIAFEPQALRLLARAASGSMRDALSLTDQAIAYSAGEITQDAVSAMLGALDARYLIRLIDALLARDGAAVLAIADEMALRSLSFSSALQDLAGLFHRIAWAQFAPSAVLDEWPEADDLRRLAVASSPEQVQLCYQIATLGRGDLGLAPDEYAGFTMTLLRMLAFAPAAGAGGEGSTRAASGSGSAVADAAGQGGRALASVASAPARDAARAGESRGPEAVPASGGERVESVAANMDTDADAKEREFRQPRANAGAGADEAFVKGSTGVAVPDVAPGAALPAAVLAPDIAASAPVVVETSPAVAVAPAAAKTSPATVAAPAGAQTPAVAVTQTPATAPRRSGASAALDVLRKKVSSDAASGNAVSGNAVSGNAVPGSKRAKTGATAPAVPAPQADAPDMASASAAVPASGAEPAPRARVSDEASPAASGGRSPGRETYRALQARAVPPWDDMPPDDAVPPPDDAWLVLPNMPNAFEVADAPDVADVSDTFGYFAPVSDDDGAGNSGFPVRADGANATPPGATSTNTTITTAAGQPAQPIGVDRLPPGIALDAVGFAGDWPALAATLALTGIAHQLAFNSELNALDDTADGVTLRLNVPVPQYADVAQVAKLKAALADRLGRPLDVQVEIGPARRTAAALDAAARAQRQRDAEREISADPFVQQLVREFGASIVPGSIKPLSSPLPPAPLSSSPLLPPLSLLRDGAPGAA